MTRHTIIYTILASAMTLFALTGRAQDSVLQFVLTSDVHYGITRPHFRGSDSVSANVVNQAMIAVFNRLPQMVTPSDNGVGSGKMIKDIDALLITGDIANREETGIQSAAASWQQFQTDYTHKITTKDKDNKPTALWLCAGNHDVTNAIGYLKPTEPAIDASSMAGIYNMMMSPAYPKTAANYNYNTDKIHYSKDIGGIHVLFVNLWPDSAEQQWMEQDLKGLKHGTPVLLFTHSMPELEARFFTNPNGNHTINNTDKFENLLPETFKDGKSIKDAAIYEERGLAAFLKRHPEIKAYFHGHNNYTEFYDWQSPGKDFSIPCFRVDSPMKGRVSNKDETQLSFELISIDTRTKTMTVRECRWNTVPDNPSVFVWGVHKTISL
jgi:hypothetical protein